MCYEYFIESASKIQSPSDSGKTTRKEGVIKVQLQFMCCVGWDGKRAVNSTVFLA